MLYKMEVKDESPYTLCQTTDYFYIRCRTSRSFFYKSTIPTSQDPLTPPEDNHLKISRKTNEISEISAQHYQKHLQQVQINHVVKFDLLMGTIIINQEPHLLVVVDSQQVAKYLQYPIFNVIDVKFIPYRSKKYQKEEDSKEEEKVKEILAKNYIIGNYYYSYHENITTPLVGKSASENSQFTFNEFAWNTKLLQPFFQTKINRCWTIPVIQGFVAEITKTTTYYTWEYLNISRRSIHMSGTRFNSRGLDQEAHASNFVQTEEIVKCHNQLFVHVSIRGSVPLYWRQQKFRGSITYVEGETVDEETAMRNHYQQLENKYRATITTINMLSRDKSPEKQLKNRFEAMLTRNIQRPYIFFDLNSVMQQKSNGQMHINKFLTKKWQEIFGKQSFSVFQNVTLQQKQQQSIVPRINCLDCLDRTNVMMARISEAFVYEVADRINKEVDYEEKKLVINQQFINRLIKLWAVLGDKISKIYCGTGSVAAHMTLKENNSLLSTLGGALTSFNRYLNASGSDLFKQKCIDSLLGLRGESSRTLYFQHNLLTTLNQSLYCSFTETNISVLSFDTGHTSLSQNGGAAGIQSFLDLALKNCSSEVIVITLQQVQSHRKWTDAFQSNMLSRGYTLLIPVQTQKSQLLTLVFTLKTSTLNFKYIQMIDIPLRSNGGVAVFIEANHSLLCFINCRFQGGYQNRYLRLDDFNELHARLLSQTYTSHMLQQAQAVFLAGDFNLRLSVKIDKPFKFKNTVEALYSAEMGNREDPQPIKDALIYDELQTLKKSHFFQYAEGNISFLPTYCFSSKKGGFDKTKPPAWCDRIFYVEPDYSTRRGGACPPISCIHYARIEERLGSTHKAIVGTFKISVKQENQHLKKKFIEKHLYYK